MQGKPGARFVSLSWGEVGEGGVFAMFRRAKLWLGTIGEERLQQAMAMRAVVEGRLPLADRCGGPLYAAVRPPTIEWSLTHGNGTPGG